MNPRAIAIGLVCLASFVSQGAGAQGVRLPGAQAPAATAQPGPRQADYIVAVVNSEPVTDSEVRARMARLQRQLAREGRPFKQLLDDTRRQLTHQYLLHSPVTLKELAYLLGFGELGSLHRACLRWFGMSPARYRAQRAAATMAPKQK